MDKSTGTITPSIHNTDIQQYHNKLPDFKIDHSHAKLTLCEQRALSKGIANNIRILYLEDLHQQHSGNPAHIQDELDKIRVQDHKDELWPLKYWKEYRIPWQRIATHHMQGRTASECEIFWKSHHCTDNPSINRSTKWSKQENAKLVQMVQQNDEKDWIAIAQQHGCNRTALQCAQQWMTKLKPRDKVNRKWTPKEDNLLRDLVYEHGKNNFVFISTHFDNRTALNCSSRWLKSTAPYLRSGPWRTTEDIQCVLSHNAYLPKDQPIIREHTFRELAHEARSSASDDNTNDKKATKKATKKPKKRKRKKKRGTQKHGVWVLIGRQVTYRNDVKARERYMNVLHPDIDIHTRWTDEEDQRLIKYHEEHGEQWALIAKKLGTHRTDCYCRQRIRALKHKAERALLPRKRRRRSPNRKRKRKEEEMIIDGSPTQKKAKMAGERMDHVLTRRMTTRSKAKAPVILDLPETHEFAEHVQTQHTRTKKKRTTYAPRYLENPLTHTPFVGGKPNRFIVNHPPANDVRRYVVPPKPCETRNYGMLSMNHNAIDAFIETNTNAHTMSIPPPLLPMPPNLITYNTSSNDNRFQIKFPSPSSTPRGCNGNNNDALSSKHYNRATLPQMAKTKHGEMNTQMGSAATK
eukprot:233084_1